MAQIFVLSGPDVGRSFDVRHGDTVGRSPECSVPLKHASVSRHHARFEQDGERWSIVDTGSRNGVVVERRRVERAELADMQEFQVGELLLRFRSGAAEPHAAPVAPAPQVAAPAPAAFEVEEIVLEGGEDQAAPGPAPRPRTGPPSAPAPRKLDEDLIGTQVSQRVPPPPSPPLAHSMIDTGFGRAPTSAGATLNRSKAGAGERILQYHKVEAAGGGLANADLAQLSGTTKLLLFLLATALAAVVAWFAFRGTSSIKERLGGSEATPSEESVER